MSRLHEIESNDKSLIIAIRQFIYVFIQLNALIAALARCRLAIVWFSFYGRSVRFFSAVQHIVDF